jgi:ketosteroid isomerase-like protein
LHFTVTDNELLIHLAWPNPVWPHLEAAAEVRLAVAGDYAYIATYWRAKAGGPTRTACQRATTPLCNSHVGQWLSTTPAKS